MGIPIEGSGERFIPVILIGSLRVIGVLITIVMLWHHHDNGKALHANREGGIIT